MHNTEQDQVPSINIVKSFIITIILFLSLTYFAHCLSGLSQDQGVSEEHGQHGLHGIGSDGVHSKRNLNQLVCHFLSVLRSYG